MKLYEKISEDLRCSISSGQFQAGDRLPPLIKLCEKYHVSHITVLHAYHTLESENLVECHQGQGYFVRNSCSRISRIYGRFGCFTRTMRPLSPVDNYSNEINIGIQIGAVNQGIDLVLPHHAHLNAQALSSETLKLIQEKILNLTDSVDGFLLDERIPDQLIEEVLGSTGKPLVVLNRKSALPVNMVYPDNAQGLKTLLDYSRKIGYTEFIFCAQCRLGEYPETSFNHRERHELFLEYTDAAHSEVIEDSLVLPTALFIEKTLKAYERRRRKGHVLILCTTDFLSAVLYWEQPSLFREADSPGLAGLDGNGLSDAIQSVITHMKTDAMGIGLKSIELLQQSITGTSSYIPATAVIPSVFIPGNTMK